MFWVIRIYNLGNHLLRGGTVDVEMSLDADLGQADRFRRKIADAPDRGDVDVAFEIERSVVITLIFQFLWMGRFLSRLKMDCVWGFTLDQDIRVSSSHSRV